MGAQPREMWASMVIPTEVSAREISSRARLYATKSPPDPPYSSGSVSPIRPMLPISATMSYGSFCLRSSSAARGRISPWAKSRARSRHWRCSAVGSKFMVILLIPRIEGMIAAAHPAHGGTGHGNMSCFQKQKFPARVLGGTLRQRKTDREGGKDVWGINLLDHSGPHRRRARQVRYARRRSWRLYYHDPTRDCGSYCGWLSGQPHRYRRWRDNLDHHNRHHRRDHTPCDLPGRGRR